MGRLVVAGDCQQGFVNMRCRKPGSGPVRGNVVGLVLWSCLAVWMLAVPASAHAAPPAPKASWSLDKAPPKPVDGLMFAPASAEAPAHARFDGRGAVLEVVNPSPKLGTGDFTFSAWVYATDDGLDDPGDIAACFDGKLRRGWSLALRTQGGVTNSQVSVRQLQFGIDSETEPTFRDEGRPGKSLYGFSICVHDDHLYVGTCEPDAGSAGRVYRYDGPGQWFDCGNPDASNSVSSMAVYKGQLYAGTAKYRLAGSALADSGNANAGGAVFRFEGPGKWVPCGRLADSEAVGGMVVYGETLYATSLYKPAGFFAYRGESTWERLDNPKDQRTQSLSVYDRSLWATSYDGGDVFRFDGKTWTDFGKLEANTQNYSFATFQRQLFVGSWPSGKVYRWTGTEPDKSGSPAAKPLFDDTGRLGEEMEVMGMLVHNGSLYAGTLPKAEVYRFDGDGQWKQLKQLDATPNQKYRRVWTGATYKGRAFWTTLPTGHIHSMTTGAATSVDRSFPSGWHHVAATRRSTGAESRLELYIDGKLAAKSEPFAANSLDLSTDAPLRVGGGPGDSFRGGMRDIRWDEAALSPEQIGELAKTSGK
jgi:gamma-glutamylcyclotransferase (GGCT)/AIG2-like uncharacterized protein YtfP